MAYPRRENPVLAVAAVGGVIFLGLMLAVDNQAGAAGAGKRVTIAIAQDQTLQQAGAAVLAANPGYKIRSVHSAPAAGQVKVIFYLEPV